MLDALEPRTLLSGTPTGIDLGDFYYHFDQRIPLERAVDQLLVRITPESREAVLAQLVGPDGPLESFEVVATTNPEIFTVTRTIAGTGSLEEQREALLSVIDQVAAQPGVVYATETFVVDVGMADWIQATNDIYASLVPGADPAEVFNSPMFAGYRRVLGTPNQFVVTTTAAPGPDTLAVANQLQEFDNRFEYVTPNFYIVVQPQRLNDPLLGMQWHLNNTGQNGGLPGADVRAFGAWDLGISGEGIVIAVLDDAVQWDHPDLVDSAWLNPGESPNGQDDDGNGWIDDFRGWDFTDNDNDPRPTLASDNHGTSVSGVAMARGDNGLGVAGAAYRAGLMSVRIPLGRSATIDQFTSPVYYASGRTANGLGTWKAADVLNHSYGGSAPFPGWEDAFNWSAAFGRGGLGAVNFVATGNGGTGSLSYPAAFDSNIAVGGSTDGDVRVSYSQWGPGIDFLASTGGLGYNGIQNIQTTDRTGNAGYAAGDYTGIGGTGFSGTSSATPLAAGVGALVLHANPQLTFNEVRSLLRNTADKIGGVTYDANGFNIQYGYGRINAARAVQEVLVRLTVTPPTSLVENQAYSNLVVATLQFPQTPPSLAPYTAEIDFGDGTAPVAGQLTSIGGGLVRITAPGSKTFQEGGSFTLGVVVRIDGNLQATGSAPYQVGHLDVNVTANDIDLAWQDALFSGRVATFEDTDPDTFGVVDYVAQINWGDGQITTGQVLALPGRNVFEVLGTRAYGGGTYPLTVTITGPGGVVGVGTATATIEDAPFSAEAFPITVPEGMIASNTLAHFTDLDLRNLPASYYNAAIDWRDGPYASEDVGRPISDFANRPLVSTLTIDKGDFPISDLKLNLTLSHGRVNDLRATLTSPDGTTVVLFNRPSTHGGDFLGVTLDDTAERSIVTSAAPFTGSYRPQQALSAFAGRQLSGTWTLTITDSVPGLVGRLENWSISARERGVITPEPTGGFRIVGDHAYALGRNRQAVIQITDGDTTSATVTSGVTVLNQPIQARSAPVVGVEGKPFAGVLGIFVDGNPRSRASDFLAEAELPDGQVVPVEVVFDGGRRFALVGNFAFTSPSPRNPDGSTGTEPILVRIREQGMGEEDPGTELIVQARVENPPIVGLPHTFTATEGQPVSGVIARFRDGNLVADPADYQVAVNWAGGIPQGGAPVIEVQADPEGEPGVFVVVTTTPILYQHAGNPQITVTVSDRGPTPGTFGQTVVITSAGVITDAPLLLTAADLRGVFTERTPLPAPVLVGRFTDTNPSGITGALTASMNWGDGATTPVEVRSVGNGLYEVWGNHTFQNPGPHNAFLTVRSADGASAMVPTAFSVADRIVPLIGRLAPASDSGVANNDGITNIANPTVRGTIDGEPDAWIRIFVLPANGGGVMPAGSGYADANGAWSVPLTSLPDGAYQLFGVAADRQGRPSSEWTALTAPGGLVIDTAAPRIASAVYDTRIRAFRISYADTGAGLAMATLLNASLYSISGPGRPSGFGPTSLTLDPSAPNTVIARFNTRGLRGGQAVLTIRSSGLTDLAGNALREQYYVDFPGTKPPADAPFVAQYNLAGRGPIINPTPVVPASELFGAARFQQLIRGRLVPARFVRS